jgi:hypothetical protein
MFGAMSELPWIDNRPSWIDSGCVASSFEFCCCARHMVSQKNGPAAIQLSVFSKDGNRMSSIDAREKGTND